MLLQKTSLTAVHVQQHCLPSTINCALLFSRLPSPSSFKSKSLCGRHLLQCNQGFNWFSLKASSKSHLPHMYSFVSRYEWGQRNIFFLLNISLKESSTRIHSASLHVRKGCRQIRDQEMIFSANTREVTAPGDSELEFLF